MQLRALLLSATLVVAGCGGSQAPDEPAEPPTETARPSVFDPWTDTIDRAESVQQTVDEPSRGASQAHRGSRKVVSGSRGGGAGRETPALLP